MIHIEVNGQRLEEQEAIIRDMDYTGVSGSCVCQARAGVFKLHLWFCGCHFTFGTTHAHHFELKRYLTFTQLLLVGG